MLILQRSPAASTLPQARLAPHQLAALPQHVRAAVFGTAQLTPAAGAKPVAAHVKTAMAAGIPGRQAPAVILPKAGRGPERRTPAERPAAPKAFSGCIQKQTNVIYNPIYNRPGTDIILGITHSRVLHNGTQRRLAAYYSGYDTPDVAGWICNHYVPYSMIAQAVGAAIKPPASADLEAAVGWLEGLALNPPQTVAVNSAKYGLFNFNLGAQPVPNIPQVTAGPPPTFAENVVNHEVDDLIFNLANDPRNLFYWPNSTGDNGGTQLDKPTGAGGTNLAWQKARLNNYYVFLQGIGLNI